MTRPSNAWRRQPCRRRYWRERRERRSNALALFSTPHLARAGRLKVINSAYCADNRAGILRTVKFMFRFSCGEKRNHSPQSVRRIRVPWQWDVKMHRNLKQVRGGQFRKKGGGGSIKENLQEGLCRRLRWLCYGLLRCSAKPARYARPRPLDG